MGVVDGQVTVLSCLVLSRKKEIHLQSFLPLQSTLVPTSDWHQPGFSRSERTGPGFSAFKASADRPAQKNGLWRHLHAAGHMIHRPGHEADHVFH